MNQRIALGLSIVALIASLTALILCFGSHSGQVANKAESTYQRVMRTGVLRCGYGLWEPAVMRDPNTGKVSGLIYDIMQEAGKSLNLKVEYTLEVPWDSIGIALQSGKIDCHAAGIWATPARGRVMAFSDPLFFTPTVTFARIDDTRFDNNLQRIDNKDVTVALSDDDITTEIYRNDFSLAKKFEIPQFSPPEELLLAVATHKADVAFNSPPRLDTFSRGNPGKVKIVPSKKPLRIYPDCIAVDIGDEELLHVLNTAIDQMQDSGKIDKLLALYRKKYNVDYIVTVKRPYIWNAALKNN